MLMPTANKFCDLITKSTNVIQDFLDDLKTMPIFLRFNSIFITNANLFAMCAYFSFEKIANVSTCDLLETIKRIVYIWPRAINVKCYDARESIILEEKKKLKLKFAQKIGRVDAPRRGR